MNYAPYRNEETRSSIINAVVGEDAKAGWGRFFDTYAGFIYMMARKQGLQDTDADEIVQCVMLELLRNKHSSYDKKKGGFRNWLFRLTMWRVSDFLRKRRMESTKMQSLDDGYLQTIEDPNAGDIEKACGEEWAESVEREALRRLQEKIASKHFAVYHASEIEGLDAATIQRLYEVSADNLYQIRRRVKKEYQKLLAEAARELDAPRIPSEDS